jgi:hypothetical protein
MSRNKSESSLYLIKEVAYYLLVLRDRDLKNRQIFYLVQLICSQFFIFRRSKASNSQSKLSNLAECSNAWISAVNGLAEFLNAGEDLSHCCITYYFSQWNISECHRLKTPSLHLGIIPTGMAQDNLASIAKNPCKYFFCSVRH